MGGALLTTINEVADLANVSMSTVSRVLSGKAPVAEETRRKVLQAVAHLGYQPNVLAQGLRGVRLKTIALLIPNVQNLIFPATIRAIEDVANKRGYMVFLCNTDDNIKKEIFYITNLKRRIVDGIIFSTASQESKHILQLKEEGFPVVTLIRHLNDSIDSVVLNNVDGAYKATRYLLSRGLRKIAFINGDIKVKLYQDRYDGYKKAMAEGQVPVREDMISHGIETWEESYEVMGKMLKAGSIPDGIFATSDSKAMGAMRAIYDCGLRIPEDVSIIGFDNSGIAPLSEPPLTTVEQPFYEMGAAACNRLIKLIESNQQPLPEVQEMLAELVIRKSVI